MRKRLCRRRRAADISKEGKCRIVAETSVLGVSIPR
jgi:hypothetical protein